MYTSRTAHFAKNLSSLYTPIPDTRKLYSFSLDNKVVQHLAPVEPMDTTENFEVEEPEILEPPSKKQKLEGFGKKRPKKRSSKTKRKPGRPKKSGRRSKKSKRPKRSSRQQLKSLLKTGRRTLKKKRDILDSILP